MAKSPATPSYRTHLALTLVKLEKREKAREEVPDLTRMTDDDVASFLPAYIEFYRPNPRGEEQHCRPLFAGSKPESA